VTHELVTRPLADMGAGDVTDIIEVEAYDRAESRLTNGVLGAFQPRLEQSVIVDPLLPVLGLGAEGCRRVRPVILHDLLSIVSIFIFWLIPKRLTNRPIALIITHKPLLSGGRPESF